VFGRRTLWATFAVAASAALLFAAPALAAPPANDDFANAQPISLSDTVSGTLTDATVQSDEPNHTGNPYSPSGGSVWYQWTSPGTAVQVRLSVCLDGTLSPGVAVYTGTDLAALTLKAPEDYPGCRVEFNAAPNTIYSIAVYDEYGQVGDYPPAGDFQLNLHHVTPPANDDFANAQPISLPQTPDVVLDDATVETGEPNHTGDPYIPSRGSVWYQWTSPGTPVKVKFSTCPPGSTSAGPLVSIYTGNSLGALTGHASTALTECQLKFLAAANTVYKIAVYGAPTNPSDGTFPMQFRALNPPANDDFENPQTIPSSFSGWIGGTLHDATRQQGEPYENHDPDSDPASVWYRWTPAADASVRVHACTGDAPEPIRIGVYTGADVGSLTPVVPLGGCYAKFFATHDQPYMIVANIRSGHTADGPFVLNLNGPASTPSPAASVPSGQVAGAVKKCRKAKKKKHGRTHKSCAKRAKRHGV
jgi:hypothetical protein